MEKSADAPEAPDRFIDKFPKTRDLQLIDKDPNARAFFMLLLKGKDPYDVIDEMLVHYTEMKNNYVELLVNAAYYNR